MSTTPRIVFFGTPQLAVWTLTELEHAGITPALVVTAEDKPAGRKLIPTPPPVKVWATERDVPVMQVSSLQERSSVPELANGEWDIFVVAAFNLILPSWVLTLPSRGVLNVHPSLLPRLRGPSPIRSAILDDARDAVGVTVIQLDEEIDHGPIVAQARVELPQWPVPGRELDEVLFREGGRLLAEIIPLWVDQKITPEAQNHTRATYTKKFRKEDGEIRLSGNPYRNYLTYCAMDGWPGTYFYAEKNGTRVRVTVTDALYDDGVFTINAVTPEGKNEQPWEAFVTAYSLS